MERLFARCLLRKVDFEKIEVIFQSFDDLFDAIKVAPDATATLIESIIYQEKTITIIQLLTTANEFNDMCKS